MTAVKTVKTSAFHPGRAKRREMGWWAACRWLILRRLVQILFLAVFVSGPAWGVWIVKGSLASSLTLGVLPLTDPLMVLQSFLAGHVMTSSALLGAALVAGIYAVIGGRLYCSWVCPVNMVTDFAAWLRPRLGIREGVVLDRRIRYWLLAGVLAASAATGTIAWEFVNPVTMLHRGLVYGSAFGAGAASFITVAVLLLDLGVAPRAWCGALCPVGAFYGVLGSKSLLRVSAQGRARCDKCMECFSVCPERQVINPALWGADQGHGPVILARECTDCGRCIDVCSKNVFRFVSRFDQREDARNQTQ